MPNFLPLKLFTAIVNPCCVLCTGAVYHCYYSLRKSWKTIKGSSKRTNEEPKLEVDSKRYRFNDILHLKVHGK